MVYNNSLSRLTMHNPRTSLIKREQRKSFLIRELSTMLHNLCEDEPTFSTLFISRIDLSDDGGICYVYLATLPTEIITNPEEHFKSLLPQLKFYKPSMRKALAGVLQKRYTPDIKFMFDNKFEKVDNINRLLNKVQEEREEQDACTQEPKHQDE